MRTSARVCVLLAVSAGLANAQVRIAGTVWTLDGSGALIPMADAYVVVSAGAQGDVVACAATDTLGRYAFRALAPGRYTLEVEAQGFYTTHAGGSGAQSVTKTCVEAGDCGEADFRVAPSAVIEGWVTDAYGEPFPGAMASLLPDSSVDGADPAGRYSAPVGRAVADDRGYFRIWGLRPGRYELEAPPGQKRMIEIEPGQSSIEARITIAPVELETFHVSGVVEGVSEEGLRGAYLRISLLRRHGWRGPGYLRPDRTFSLSLEQGEYAIELVQALPGEGEPRFLARITVDRDIEGLRLEPHPTTGLRGRIEFGDSPATDLRLSLLRSGDGPGWEIPVEAKGGAFEKAGLLPDDYALSAASPDYYVIAPTTVTIGPGRMEPLVVHMSNQRGSVRGVARTGAEGERVPAPFAAVALTGERGQRRAQADAEGRFHFEKLIPGEYEITARSDLEAPPLSKDARRLTVEPGFEVEIDLTVSQ